VRPGRRALGWCLEVAIKCAVLGVGLLGREYKEAVCFEGLRDSGAHLCSSCLMLSVQLQLRRCWGLVVCPAACIVGLLGEADAHWGVLGCSGCSGCS